MDHHLLCRLHLLRRHRPQQAAGKAGICHAQAQPADGCVLEVKQDATLPPTELVTHLTAIGALLLPVLDLQHLACSMLHEGTKPLLHCPAAIATAFLECQCRPVVGLTALKQLRTRRVCRLVSVHVHL